MPGQNSVVRSFLGTFALVFASMAGLWVLDTFLENTEISESRAEAQRLYREGEALLQQGQYSAAIEQFRNALSFSRENPDYQLALANALTAAKKYSDAEVEVQGLLAQDPSNGPANLTMARILVKKGRMGEATFYYHRSIYGRWPESASMERLHVRLELVNLLAQENNKQDLLAELLPLQDENFDIATRERIAQLYLTAGSPNRAADMFREILHEQPSNAQAFAGLGAAEFAKGNYRGARTDFLNASRLQPSNTDYRKELNTSAKVLELDPMLRGLSSHERYERATRLVEIASQAVSSCLGANVPPDTQPLLDAAQKALTAHVRANQEDDATNANLDLAEKLFAVRKKDCKQPLTDDEEPAALVLAKTQ